jgi:hypothetical protein
MGRTWVLVLVGILALAGVFFALHSEPGSWMHSLGASLHGH